MPRIVIGPDIGRVSFGPHELPGVFQRLSVDVALEVDKKKVPGKSGLSKQPLGFNDADVSLQLKLVPGEDGSDPYEQLAALRLLFYGTDAKARPQSYPVVNRTCRAMGIKKVLFEQIRVVDENTTDALTVEIKFSSYEPAVRRKEKRAKAKIAKEAASSELQPAPTNDFYAAGLAAADKILAQTPNVIKVVDGAGSMRNPYSPEDLAYIKEVRTPATSSKGKALQALKDFGNP